MRLVKARPNSGPAVPIVVLLVLVGIVLGGCGSGPGPTSSPTTVPATVAASVLASTGPSPASSAAVAADPSLLAMVPASTIGIRLEYDPDTTANVAADPKLASDATALATGLARVDGASADAPDFAIVNVVRLRNPASDEGWFRSWRDSYDQAACAQAGGVSGHAQFEVGGLTAFVGVCTNNAFTYHVRLDHGAVVLSITSFGPGNLGRRIVDKLQP